MKQKNHFNWFGFPFGRKLRKLHRWNAWIVLILALSGVLLFVPAFRSHFPQARVWTKDVHLIVGVISIVVVALYLPMIRRHLKQIKRKPVQQWNLRFVLLILAGWIVSGVILWQFRRLPHAWSNAALIAHDLFTWVGVPYAIYHSLTRMRWLKRIDFKPAVPVDGEKAGERTSDRRSRQEPGAIPKLELPGISGNLKVPGSPELPGSLEILGNPGLPGSLGILENPEISGSPKIPGNPELSGSLGNSGNPEIPESLEIPGNPELPGSLELSRNPELPKPLESSKVPGSPENPKKPVLVSRSIPSFISRRSFIRWVIGLALALSIGPSFIKWLKFSFDSGSGPVSEWTAAPEDLTVPSDASQMVPPPEPLPDSAVPVGGGAKGNFRIYTITEMPSSNAATWNFTVAGLVGNPLSYNWEQFMKLPRTVQVSDFHCVTGWSVYNCTWEGIPLKQMLDLAQVQSDARFVKFYSGDGVYTDTLSMEQARMDDVMVVCLLDGKPLPKKLGGPVRLIVPKMYTYKSVKWLEAIELIDRDQIGYWERYGYDRDAWIAGS